MFVVDTNALVFAAERSFPEHARCRTLVAEWRASAASWHTTWGILYEFLRVTTHPRVFRRPWAAADAWSFVDAVLAAPGLEVLRHTSRHAEVAAEVMDELPDLRGNLLHDAHTAILMREPGVSQIYTRDTDFHRFPFLRVADPLGSP